MTDSYWRFTSICRLCRAVHFTLFMPGGKVQVVLVVDYDGVFKALNFHQSTTEALEALEV